MKAFANTALGHFVVGLLTVAGLAAFNYVLNSPAVSDALVSYGVPVVVVKGIVDLFRASVPNA